MNKRNRIAVLIFLAPIVAALLYTLYYRESRRSLMERLVDSGVIAMLEGDIVTRDDLRDYFQYPPIEENAILRSLELTPEDVKGIGLHEKDRELFNEQSGQLLLYQVIKHIALIKYLTPRYENNERDRLQEVTQQYRETLMAEAMEKDLARISPDVSQEEMLGYYVENPKEFYQQGKRYARHLMLYEGKENGTAENPFSLTPETVWSRLQNGEDFYSLIVESRSETSTQEGILGWLPYGSLNKKFEDALWALDIGEITGPIHIDDTIHFVQCLDIQPEGLIPFDDCRERIQEILMEDKRSQHRYKLLGLETDSLRLESDKQNGAYREAILKAAYAREWHKNVEIVRRTNAFTRYYQANLVFQEEMNGRKKGTSTSRSDDSTWILENKTAIFLLEEMGFRLLINLDIPHNRVLEKEYPAEE